MRNLAACCQTDAKGAIFVKDLVIIGAGPAGLTAALYACRAGLSVLVLDKGVYGGQIALAGEVENFPGIERIPGPTLSETLYRQATAQGAQLRFEEVTALSLEGPVKTVTTDAGTHQARTVIAATGVRRRQLDCPGEKEFTGRGVSYCATCDGAFFRNKTVAVVGGGNTALEDALFLSNLCSQVYLVHRRDQFRADQVTVQAALQRENITPLYSHQVVRVEGEGTVKSVILRGPEGERPFAVDALFVAVGLVPDNALFAGQLPTDAAGYFEADEQCTTPVPGVFVAGDCRRKPLRQVITAAADGATAAWQAANYLNAHRYPQ